MSNNLSLSVMIPCYNRADLLAEALQSVMSQHIENLMEVWVVDDCSTKDNPEEVVNKYGRGLVKFFKQEQNVGQIKNLNKCIDLANGELIHILHCDDRILPGFYTSILEAYKQSPSSSAFFTRNNYINHEGNLLSVSISLQENSGLIDHWFEKISTAQLIQTPSMVVKKDVYKKLGGFNEKLSWTEDWEMWVRISKNYPVYYINNALAEYREANNSNSADSFITGRFIDDLKRVIVENYMHHQSVQIKNSSIRIYSEYIINTILKLSKAKKISKKTIFNLFIKYFQNKFSKKYLLFLLIQKAKIIIKRVVYKLLKLITIHRSVNE